MQMSSEREGDRALKRQVITITSNLSPLTDGQTADAHGICPNFGRHTGREEGPLFARPQTFYRKPPADLSDRLEGRQRVPQCYGSSWQHMIDLTQSLMGPFLALYWESV